MKIRYVSLRYRTIVRAVRALREAWDKDKPIRHAQLSGLLLSQMYHDAKWTLSRFIPTLVKFAERHGPEGIDGILLSALDHAIALNPDFAQQMFDRLQIFDFGSQVQGKRGMAITLLTGIDPLQGPRGLSTALGSDSLGPTSRSLGALFTVADTARSDLWTAFDNSSSMPTFFDESLLGVASQSPGPQIRVDSRLALSGSTVCSAVMGAADLLITTGLALGGASAGTSIAAAGIAVGTSVVLCGIVSEAESADPSESETSESETSGSVTSGSETSESETSTTGSSSAGEDAQDSDPSSVGICEEPTATQTTPCPSETGVSVENTGFPGEDLLRSLGIPIPTERGRDVRQPLGPGTVMRFAPTTGDMILIRPGFTGNINGNIDPPPDYEPEGTGLPTVGREPRITTWRDTLVDPPRVGSGSSAGRR